VTCSEQGATAANPDRRFLANTAVLAFIGFLVAGLFEYTYGHSLGLIMISFAVFPALMPVRGRPSLICADLRRAFAVLTNFLHKRYWILT
jgi:hypothetical protein